MKVTDILLNDIEIHKLALSTPKMTNEQYKSLKQDIKDNGQLEPIKMYRGKVVDGRHRVLVMKELQADTIKATAIPSTTSIEEVKQMVTSYETRRHQTPTQKAIYALYEYDRLRANGVKESQEAVCARYGTNRKMLSRAKKLSELVSNKVIEHMFNGGKINIGTESKPLMTDSLLSVYNYFKANESEVLEASAKEKAIIFTDDELHTLSSKLEELEAELGTRLLTKLSGMIYSRVGALSLETVDDNLFKAYHE